MFVCVLCWTLLCSFLPPATKLRQGNVFTPVCGRGSLSRRWASVQGVSVQAGHCPGEEGLCPGWGSLSGSSLSMGVSVQRVSVQGDPPPKYGYVRAVRILLECILVHNCWLRWKISLTRKMCLCEIKTRNKANILTYTKCWNVQLVVRGNKLKQTQHCLLSLNLQN